MVLPISGFLPVPLPMMIPFMGAQSLVIGKMFGEGFQYGKRKISAMPNEEFNKLTFQDMMSNARSEMQASIPTMQAALHDMQPLVETVIKEFFDYLQIVLVKSGEIAKESVFTGQGIFSPEQVGNKALIDDVNTFLKDAGVSLDEFWKAAGLPSPPVSAFATNAGASIDLIPSTISGLTVGKAQQQAKDKQKAFEKQKELDRLAAIRGKVELGKIPQPIPVGVKWQKAAGQSQKRERLRLIHLINYMSGRLSTKFFSPNQIKNNAAKLRGYQQSLVNLLARYRF